ncbi:MAG: DUF1887 domain-containing protein [Pegethrix bostrychoides GSE-TBD4-15B]|uniref:DUF1887 domain-containing protein n=1 Tax=Pegethrix bostrychoides GSE-TBD4-15B TaxID=2839662 RepID=A0A951P9N5_9CYAN|nr:DUF1887 domain-containing protein [Pegethrix bostrychoides GSE-TBD4-15B]
MLTAAVASEDAALQIRQTVFEPYQVDHLLLLIGENPLPSYVAARTLLKAGGTPYLVHSSHTKEQADRVRDLLRERSPALQPCQYISLGDCESDGYYIQKEIQEAIKPHIQEKWGLNYTGGTKPMATHAYRVLLKLQSHAVFSYLDPRHLEMCIDREDGDRIRRKVGLKISLEELFHLHHLAFQSLPVSQPKLPEVITAFVDVGCQQDWQTWKRSGMQLKELPEAIKVSLQPYINPSSATVCLDILQEKGEFDQDNTVKKWIDHNDWFEHYVLHQVQSIANTYNIHESKAAFHIKDLAYNAARRRHPNSQGDPEKRFEIDVAFMRNYQLFALSCSISKTKSTLKEKLFEVYLRAKQLGGDEARVALVCFSEEPEILEYELKIVLDNPKIKVFGKTHLLNLADEIAVWIEQTDREAK